jgi:hypothetical protein
MMIKYVDISYPCMWVVPEAMTGVVPSLVHLHHLELTVWTPRPQHCLLRCIASNITRRFEVTLAFQREIGFEIFWLLMPQLRTKTMFILTPRSHCLMLWEEGNGLMVLHICRRRVAGWWALRSVGRETKQWLGETHPSIRALSLCGPVDPWEGNVSVTQRKHNDSAYYSHCNETHVTDKTHSNAVRLKFLRIQNPGP